MLVNHVMSNEVQSSIFNAIYNYFCQFAPEGISFVKSVKPIVGADVYHYYRPNLEKNILSNSVITVHHDLAENDPWLDIENFIPKYRQAKKIICLNNTQQEILKGLGISNTTVIPHGYNEEIFTFDENEVQAKSKETDKFRILITSKRYPRRVKGESYIYELLKFLDPELIEFVLVGEQRSLDREYFERFGFNVEIHEYLPYKIFGNLYRSVDFLLMTSFYEGGPANIPEAIAAGLPIICNPIALAKDYVKNLYNGIYLTMDPRTDGRNILKVIKTKFNCIKKNAIDQKTRSQALTWETVVNLNINVYKEVMA